ncbi:MAG TPA: hypothetical protein VHD33_06920 [Legionellaceae bacterium]|nr:hypothetical protein [Legionellaceae bacterium]
MNEIIQENRSFESSETISNLIEHYQNLQNQNVVNRLHNEKSKLEIIKSIKDKLNREIQVSTSTQQPTNLREDNNSFFKHLKTIIFYFLTILGIGFNSSRNYLSATFLIAVIPKLTQPVQIFLAIVFVFFQEMLFLGFEISLLKKAFDPSSSKTDLFLLIDIYIEQIHLAKEINKQLSCMLALSIDDDSYHQYMQFVKLLNHDIQKKCDITNNYENSVFRKALTAATLVIGIISSIASSYFMITTILKALATSIISTPLGGFIIALAILVDLGFYYAMGATSVLKLMNANNAHCDLLKKEVDGFQQEYSCQFWRNSTYQRQKLHIKVCNDMAVQTEDMSLRMNVLAVPINM